MPIPSEEGADIVVNVNGKRGAKAKEWRKRVNGIYFGSVWHPRRFPPRQASSGYRMMMMIAASLNLQPVNLCIYFDSETFRKSAGWQRTPFAL